MHSIEIALKLFGFGAYLFFSDNWNVYDLIIVVAAVLEKLIGALPIDPAIGRLIRVLRVFRFVRLISAFRSLNKLVLALWKAILEVLWVGVLSVLIIYMCACLSTTLIGRVLVPKASQMA